MLQKECLTFHDNPVREGPFIREGTEGQESWQSQDLKPGSLTPASVQLPREFRKAGTYFSKAGSGAGQAPVRCSQMRSRGQITKDFVHQRGLSPKA